MTALNTKLLPCPHCGGEAELDTGQAYRSLSDGTIGSRAVVYCARCGADVGFCYEDARGTPREDIVNQVVDDWNRRVSPSQGEGPAAEVVEALSAVEIENALEDAAKAAFVRAQSVYRADHDHFPLKFTWETTTESVRDGWRAIAHSAIEAAAVPPLGTQPEPRRPRHLASPAQRAAQEAPADEQSGETSHVAVSDAMVEAVLSWVCDDVLPAYDIPSDVPRNDPELPDSCRAALTAAIGAGGQAVAVKRLIWEEDHGIAGMGPYRFFKAETPLGRFVYGTDAEGSAYYHTASSGVMMVGDEATAKRLAEASWQKAALNEAGKYVDLSALAHPSPSLPLRDEVERVLEDSRQWVEVFLESSGVAAIDESMCRSNLAALDALLSRLRAGAQEGWRLDARCDYCKEHGFQHPNLCEDCCNALAAAPSPEAKGGRS